MTTWFTSDMHFGHTNVIKYSKRPFSSVLEMNEAIINNYNSLVKPSDDAYIIGDFAFTKPEPFLERLTGRKHLVLGNHDHRRKKAYLKNPNLIWVRDVSEIKINGQSIWLSHYSHRVWNKWHLGAWHLYGHSHGYMPDHGLSTDVGVDCWDYKPVSFEQLADRFKDRKPDTKTGFNRDD